MTYIFLDESGDLGFKEQSSKWFIFSIVLTNDHRKIEKIMKKVHKDLKKKYRKIKELHAYHSQPITRKRVLRALAGLDDLKIMCIVLNKEKVYVDLRNQKKYLYNYTANILLDRLHNKKILKPNDEVLIYIDQRDTNKFLRESFEKYLSENLKIRGASKFKIKIKPSHTEKCLQAVDFVSWAIFRKYEKNDEEYYKIIKTKLVEENLLFK